MANQYYGRSGCRAFRKRTRLLSCHPLLFTTSTVATCIIVLSCSSSWAEGLLLSSLFGSSLGPDAEKEAGKCSGDRCRDDPHFADSLNTGHGGFVPPMSDPVLGKTDFQMEGNLEDGSSFSGGNDKPNYEVTKRDESVSVLSVFGSSVTGVFSTASDYVSRKVYNKAANVTQEFADKVREVFHEELYGFVDSSANKIWDLLLSPDTLLGAVLQTYGKHALSLSLIVVVIVTDYILLQFFSFLSVITLDCTLLLLHRICGPQWIYSKLFVIGQYTFSFIRFLARHPYISAALIILLFVVTILIPIMRWSVRVRMKDKIDVIWVSVSKTAQEVDSIGKTVKDLNQRIQKMEAKQEEILELLKALPDHRT